MDYTPSLANATNRAFVPAFSAQPGHLVPDFSAVAAYDALAAVYKAVAAQNGNLDPDKALAFWRGLQLDSPRGSIAIDPKTRDIVENIYARRIVAHGGRADMVELQTFPMVRDATEQ